jgi:hypothetical protein
MNEFWALSKLDMLILLLKILLVAFGWGSLIFCSVLIIVLTVDYIKEWIVDWKEARAKNKQRKLAKEQLSLYASPSYSVGIAPARPIYNDRPHWADTPTDVYKIAEEIRK